MPNITGFKFLQTREVRKAQFMPRVLQNCSQRSVKVEKRQKAKILLWTSKTPHFCKTENL